MRSAFAASVTASLLALAALLAPLASAAPTSNSVVNEYTERLPEGGGGQPGGPGGGGGEVDPNGGGSGSGSGGSGSGGGSFEGGSGGEGGSGSTASPLSAETERQLDAQGGEAGKNLSGIVQETGTAGGGNAEQPKASDEGSSEGFLDSIGGALSNFASGSDTGLGAGFPILLGLILAGAVTFVVARGRSGRLDA